MTKFMTGLLALAWLMVALPFAAQAQSVVNYKPGALKAAAAQGKSVLLHYKSTW